MKGTMYRRLALVVVTAVLCGCVFAGTKPAKSVEDMAVEKALTHIKEINLRDVHLVSYTCRVSNSRFLSEESKIHYTSYRTSPLYKKLGQVNGDADMVIKVVFNPHNKDQVTVVTKRSEKSMHSNKKQVQIPSGTFVA